MIFISGAGIVHKLLWGTRLEAYMTRSESQWENAVSEFKQRNKDVVLERVNPPINTKLGKLGTIPNQYDSKFHFVGSN